LKLPEVFLDRLTPDLPPCHQQAPQAEAPNEHTPNFNYHRPIGNIFNLTNPDNNQQTPQPVPLPTCKPSPSSRLNISCLPLPSESHVFAMFGLNLRFSGLTSVLLSFWLPKEDFYLFHKEFSIPIYVVHLKDQTSFQVALRIISLSDGNPLS
jgi:hypothetical protein